MRVRACVVILIAVLCTGIAVHPEPATSAAQRPAVRTLAISYRAHDGLPRRAYLILPAWYGSRDHPPIPLVISPHGRGVGARTNVRRWGRSARAWTFRSHQSRRAGPCADPLFLGRPRRDPRPRTNAGHHPARGPVAADRSSSRLRGRRQHGGPGDSSARREVPTLAGGRRCVRCSDEHGRPLPGLRQLALRRRPAEVGAPRDRRHSGD
jgi:hypothetical protein